VGGVPPFSAKSAEKDGATAELGDRSIARRPLCFPGSQHRDPGAPRRGAKPDEQSADPGLRGDSGGLSWFGVHPS